MVLEFAYTVRKSYTNMHLRTYMDTKEHRHAEAGVETFKNHFSYITGEAQTINKLKSPLSAVFCKVQK